MLDFQTKKTKQYCHPYHVRHSDEDERMPATIEKHVVVNHYGVLWFPAPLPEVEERGCIDLDSSQRELIRNRKKRRTQ